TAPSEGANCSPAPRRLHRHAVHRSHSTENSHLGDAWTHEVLGSARARCRAERLRPIAGQISEALRVVQSIEGTLLTAGHLGTINGRKADHDRRRALYEIARAQAKASLIAQALQTARSIGLAGEVLGSGLGVEPLSVPGSTQAKM